MVTELLSLFGISEQQFLTILASHLILLVGAICGWYKWYFQLKTTQKLKRRDEFLMKRIEAYKRYLGKYDDIENALRYDGAKIIGRISDMLVHSLLKYFEEGEESAEQELKDHASLILHELVETIDLSTHPSRILSNEINMVILLGSEDVKTKIEDFKNQLKRTNDSMKALIKEIKPLLEQTISELENEKTTDRNTLTLKADERMKLILEDEVKKIESRVNLKFKPIKLRYSNRKLKVINRQLVELMRCEIQKSLN
jgi:hypothetical protein